MATDNKEFKFPDEVENAASSEVEVELEVIDDTPPADRGRQALPAEIVKELEADDLEEYSDKVKKRLGQMKKVWHDERRAKETATREREEAIHYAQGKDQEIKDLRGRIGRGEQIFVTEISKAATGEVAAAREHMKRAYEAGDADAIADAQEELTDAKLKLREIQQIKPSLQEPTDGVQTKPQAQAPQQQVDPKAEAWRQDNTWFGVDEEMTSLALGLHGKLVRSGVDPRSDDYYEKVNATIRKRFPEHFEGAESEQPKGQETPALRKSANVVAPVTRSTAPVKVRLTQTQVALAKKFGLTPEAYAKELVKLENYNG